MFYPYNISKFGRVARVVVGIIFTSLLFFGVTGSITGISIAILGAYVLITGIIGYDPIMQIFSTTPSRSPDRDDRRK